MLARTLFGTDSSSSKYVALLGSVVLAIESYRFVPAWVRLAMEDDRYFYTLFAPIVCAGIVWAQRRSLEGLRRQDRTSDSRRFAWVLIALAVVLGGADWGNPGVPTLGISAMVLTVCALVWFFCGEAVLRHLAFPLGCLILVVPLPMGLMHGIVTVLQQGSAEFAHMLFRATGMPVFRESTFEFALPGISIEVAEECSGIRSATTLVVSSVVASYWLLNTVPQRITLILLSIPIAIFKNAIRIVVLSWLGVYVDRGYFFGNLHQRGGLAFSVLAIAMLFAAIFLLRRAVPKQPAAGNTGD